MKPLLPLATVLIGLAWFVPGAKAADLAARHRHVRPLPPPPTAVPFEPDVPVYTRPVLGFYAYPFDYGVPPSRLRGGEPATSEPYAIRDDPHGVAIR